MNTIRKAFLWLIGVRFRETVQEHPGGVTERNLIVTLPRWFSARQAERIRKRIQTGWIET